MRRRRERDVPLIETSTAIKVLPDPFAGDPERPARFKREARMLASLNHSNTAIVHGFGEHEPGVVTVTVDWVPLR